MRVPDWLAQHVVLALLLGVAVVVLWRLLRLLALATALALLVASLPWIIHGEIPPWAQESGQWLARGAGSLTSWVITTVRTVGHR